LLKLTVEGQANFVALANAAASHAAGRALARHLADAGWPQVKG
jgi:hypothetical protein